MEEIFEKTYTLRLTDFDSRMELRPACIMDIFQAAAGEHAEKLGVGFKPMIERELMWVIAKFKIKFLNRVGLYQQVKVRTWPLAPEKVGFQREYIMEDMKGRMIAGASAQWVLMHSTRRRLMPVKDVYPENIKYCGIRIFDDRLVKCPDSENCQEQTLVCPALSDLDVNGHVNHCKYAAYVTDALGQIDERIDTIQIDYHREVKLAQPLHIKIDRNGDTVLAKGESDAGESMFNAMIKLREPFDPKEVDYTLRRAVESDIRPICSAADIVWHERYSSILVPQQITYMLDKFQSPHAVRGQMVDGYIYDLLMAGEEIGGYSAYKLYPDHVYLSKLYILAPHRKKGLSRKMLENVVKLARESGVDKIRLNVNKYNSDSIAAYKALGFKVVADEVNDIGHGYVMDDYVMEAQL